MAKSKPNYKIIQEGGFTYTVNQHRHDRLEHVVGTPNPPDKVNRRGGGGHYNFLKWITDTKNQHLANGGHVVGLLLGGANKAYNICTMHARTNGGLYLKTELRAVKDYLDGHLATIEIDMLYIDNMLGLSNDELDFYHISPALRAELVEQSTTNPLFKDTSVDAVYSRTPRVIMYHLQYHDGRQETVKIINPLLPQELDQELFLTNQQIHASRRKPTTKAIVSNANRDIADAVQQFIEDMPKDLKQELFGNRTPRQNRLSLNAALQELLVCDTDDDFFQWRARHKEKRDIIRRLLVQHEPFLQEKGVFEVLDTAYRRSIDENVFLTKQLLDAGRKS